MNIFSRLFRGKEIKDKKIIIFNDTRTEKHYGCDCVMRNLIEFLRPFGNIIYYYKTSQTNWKSKRKILSKLKKADLVIVNGEGSIHHSNDRAQSLASIAPYVKSMPGNKKCVLLNATLFANNKEIYNNLSHFDSIYVRDKYSTIEANNFGVSTKRTPDFTFYTDIFTQDIGTDIAVGESVIPEVTQALNKYNEQNNYKFLDISHFNNNNLESYLEILKTFKFVITGRFHKVCFCINAKIPFVAVESNTNKIESILLDVFKTKERLLDINSLSSTNIEKFIKFSPEEIQQIDDYKKEGKQSFENLKFDLQRLIL